MGSVTGPIFPGGVVMTTVMGSIWGAALLLCGRNLRVEILAHSAAHVVLVLQLYLALVPMQWTNWRWSESWAEDAPMSTGRSTCEMLKPEATSLAVRRRCPGTQGMNPPDCLRHKSA
jgi:hypothetical protein